ncbi:hexokinase-like [Littorina saxatilis]|uniref:hexokinase-like n=1 Tax=Littorina saxatilis TaxID=31220 RepID=UPI0038B54510
MNQDVESASRQPLIPSNPTHVECITPRAAAHTYTRDMESVSRQPLIPSNPTHVECITQRAAAHTDTRIDAHLKDFRLDAREYGRIMSLLQREIQKWQTQMSSTLVKSLQNERETGYCLVVVLGSITLKVVLFNMQGENVDCSQAQTYKIPTEVRQVTGEQLLKFIANSISNFVDTHKLSSQRMPLGCVVSFPCEHAQDNGHHLTKVQLTKWTKGFSCKDLVGRNMDDILQEALRNNAICNLEIKAIINDAVDMLVSTAHQDTNSKIALVLGDGFNACFVQYENKMYTTTECGSFGDRGSLDVYRTDFDRELDNSSMNSGEQIMEKMVSMVYIGELVRLVLVKLTQERLLFKYVGRESALYLADSFKTSFMPLVERDTEGNFENTEFVLRMLEVESFTDEDCATVQCVCRIITERAAHLAATVVAALVQHVEQPEITIAIDKSLYKAHPRFHQLLSEKTIELVGEGFKVNIKPFPNESGRGAALLAAVAK